MLKVKPFLLLCQVNHWEKSKSLERFLLLVSVPLISVAFKVLMSKEEMLLWGNTVTPLEIN